MTKKIMWIPRILTIIFIVFISLFALDSFQDEEPFFNELIGFLIHLLPSFILTGILALSWKKPFIGGAALVGMGLLLTFFFRLYARADYFFLISFPFILAGALFILFSYFPSAKIRD